MRKIIILSLAVVILFSPLLTGCGPKRKIVANGTKIRSSRNVTIRAMDANLDLRNADVRAGKDVNVCSEGDIILPENRRFGGSRDTIVSGKCR